MTNDITVLVHHLRCVGGTQDERASETGARSRYISRFSTARRDGPRALALAHTQSHTGKSRWKLAARPRSTLQSWCALIHLVYNVPKDHLARSRSDYYAPSAKRTHTQHVARAHRMATHRRVSRHRRSALSCSVLDLAHLGSRVLLQSVPGSQPVRVREELGRL